MTGATSTLFLVARREFLARVRSRAVLAGALGVAVLLVAFLFLQAFVFGGTRPIRVGLAGQASALAETLPQATASLGVAVTVNEVDNVADGVAQVRDGQLDVLVSGARAALHVTVDNQLDPQLRTTLNGLVRQQVLDAQIAQLGVRPQDVLSRVDQAQISLTQLNVSDPNRGQRVGIGVLVELLVTLAVGLFAGLAAVRAAQRRRDGTAEVLLPLVRPDRLLLADLAGLGAAGLAVLAAIGVLGAVVALATGVVTLPGSLFVGFGAGLLWYVLGFALLGTVCATTRRPRRSLLAGLVGVYVVSTVLLAADPGGAATAVLSVLPPFAPVLLVGRLVVGVASAWQVVLAVVLALATVAVLAVLGGRAVTSGPPVG